MVKTFLPILFAILLMNCTRTDDESISIDINNKFSLKKLIEDYTILRIALEEAHPGIYGYTKKEKFDILFDSLNSEIRSGMTEIDFFRFISPIIANIGCGHTGLSPSLNYWNFLKEEVKYFPLQLKFIEDKAYVLKSYSSDELIPSGSQILSINKKSISEIISKLFKMISSDGNIQTAKYRRLDEEFSKLYFLYINPEDSFKIEYISRSDNLPRRNTLLTKLWKDIKTYKSSYMQRQ